MNTINETVKSPIEMLDSLVRGCVYKLVSSFPRGATHEHKISVNVGDRTFFGVASNKLLAQDRAASSAISTLFPQKMLFVTIDLARLLPSRVRTKTRKSLSSKRGKNNKVVLEKPLQSPMNILSNLRQDHIYHILSSRGNGENISYTVAVKVDGHIFKGYAKTIQLAKHRAASSAISDLYPHKVQSVDPKYLSKTQLQGSRYFKVSNMLAKKSNDEKIQLNNEQKLTMERKLQNTSNVAKAHASDIARLKEPVKSVTDMLSSLRSDCTYTHEHILSVSVGGRNFSGIATTESLAKHRASRAALSALYPDKMKFIVDDSVSAYETYDSNQRTKSSKKSITYTLPEITFECVTNSNTNIKNRLPAFKCKFKLDGSEYYGCGTSKKNAKASAISEYLLQAHHILTQPETNGNCSDYSVLDPIFANKISKIVNDKYLEVAKDFPKHSKKAVLSAIVMTKSKDFSDAEVLNITTGTKCINGGYLSFHGASLNDCHAEVLSRRGLMSYFYDQLMLHAKPQTANYSIFVMKKDSKGFELKPGIKFHLYVSTSCCGDARMVSPHDKKYSANNLNRPSKGQLKAKIESGEGTVPVKSSNDIQTWDGIMGGKKLVTMSCSDKVAKWNVVGVQGSLLTLFLDPIYLYSITVGSLFHPMHTKRALYGRIEQYLPNLPAPFKHNKIFMNTISSQEPRVAAEPPIYSSNWLIHDPQPEIINSNTGKCCEGMMSRLCKISLFLKFKELLILNLPPRTHFDKQLNIYLDLKKSSTDYNITKEMFYKACADADLGKWVKKPIEQDDFEVDF